MATPLSSSAIVAEEEARLTPDDITFLEEKKQATMSTIEAIRMAKFVKSKKRCVAGLPKEHKE